MKGAIHMKSIVIYSSQTGRTRKIAEAIAAGLPQGTPCLPLNEMPANIKDYDCVFFGLWEDRRGPDPEAQAVLKTLENEHIVIFATVHDDVFSDNVSKTLRNMIESLPPQTRVDGTYVTCTDGSHAKEPIRDNEDLRLSDAPDFAENTLRRIEVVA